VPLIGAAGALASGASGFARAFAGWGAGWAADDEEDSDSVSPMASGGMLLQIWTSRYSRALTCQPGPRLLQLCFVVNQYITCPQRGTLCNMSSVMIPLVVQILWHAGQAMAGLSSPGEELLAQGVNNDAPCWADEAATPAPLSESTKCHPMLDLSSTVLQTAAASEVVPHDESKQERTLTKPGAIASPAEAAVPASTSLPRATEADPWADEWDDAGDWAESSAAADEPAGRPPARSDVSMEAAQLASSIVMACSRASSTAARSPPAGCVASLAERVAAGNEQDHLEGYELVQGGIRGLLAQGLGVLGLQGRAARLADFQMVVVFVVGGIMADEIAAVDRLMRSSAPSASVLVGGSHLTTAHELQALLVQVG
jgi:hypothetical protein